VNLIGREWFQALPPTTSDCVIAIVSADPGPLPVKAVIRKPLEIDRLAEIVSNCGQSKIGSSNDAA